MLKEFFKKYGALAISARAALALAIILFLAPFLYAFGFCYPRGDDFDEATRAMFFLDLPGGLYEIGREWLTWSGRYSYHFLAVFFGKAAESRPLYGLVCASVLCLYWLSFLLITKNLACKRPFLLSCLLIVCLLAAHQTLPNFYLLTDALTSCLQGGAWLLFLGCLSGLAAARDPATIRTWRDKALITGIFAIGIYEHAALAVIITSFFFLLHHLPFSEIKFSASSWKKKLGQLWKNPFFFLSLWLTIALLVSFLAPGNSRRAILRGIDPQTRLQQLGDCLPIWLDSFPAFFHTPWPWLMALIAILAATLSSAPRRPGRARVCLLILLAYSLFSACVICLHALSDVPFPTEPKLGASLNFYAAMAFGGILFTLLTGKIGTGKFNIALISSFLCLCFLTPNFRQTIASVANGQMVLLADFMSQRRQMLENASKAANSREHLPPSGLIGEIRFPDARQTKIRPSLPRVTVSAFPWPVFPVYMAEALAPESESWPNMWAAWFHGVGSLKAIPGALPARFRKISLVVPPQLGNAGVKAVWRVTGEKDSGINDWLLVATSENIPVNANIFRVSAINAGRLLPVPLQKKWLNFLAREASLEWSWPMNLFGLAQRVIMPGATPLGMVDPDAPLPPIFVNHDENIYYQLKPFEKEQP